MNAPDTPPPAHKPMTVSSFLISCLMTGAMICGAIGALAVVFLGDELFKPAQDPAIRATEVKQVNQQLARTDDRLAQLEKMIRAQQSAATAQPEDLQALQQTLDANKQETEELREKVDTLSSGATQDNKAAQIALGLTQIKTAYENDLPMTTGIETLKNAVTTESLRKSLSDLEETTSKNFPSKKELLADLDAMKASVGAPQTVNPGQLNWQQRAKYEMNKFVQIQPKQIARERSLIDQAENDVRNSNFAAALETIKQLPETAEQKVFYQKIILRSQAEMALHGLITDITQKVGQATGTNSGGSLY